MNAECKPSGYISMPNCRPFLPSALYEIHKPKPMDGWTDGRTHEMTTIPIGINVGQGQWLPSGNICISNSMSFLPSDLSANVQKPENVVNRPIDGQTDGQTDGQKSGRGHYCWGVLLWPPQLGLGGKCDKKWKFKNVEKITSFSDAVTLTFDLRPWKVNQVRTLSLPMCIPNLRTIHPVVFELPR